MKTLTATIIGLLIWGSPLALAEEVAVDHLVQALLNSGERTISTGEFHYTLQVQEETPTSEMVEAQVEAIRSQLKEQMKIHEGNPDMVSRLQKAIDTAPEYVPPQVLANAKLQFQMYFALGGPELGGDRYVEMAQFDRATNTYRDPQQLLFRSRGASSGTSIDLEPSGEGMVIVGKGRQSVYLPTQEPHRLGRVNGTLSSITRGMTSTAIKKTLSKQVTNVQVERVSDGSDVETLKLEFQLLIEYPEEFLKQFPDATSEPRYNTVVYHVVPSRGYITPLVREIDINATTVFEYECADYFRIDDSDLWFPARCDYRSDVMRNNKPHIEHYEFSTESVVLNSKIAEARFTIPIVTGTSILDARDGENTSYHALSDVSLSIDDTDDLSQVGSLALSPSPILHGPHPIAPKQGWSISIIIANMILLFLLGIVMWRKRIRSSSTGGCDGWLWTDCCGR